MRAVCSVITGVCGIEASSKEIIWLNALSGSEITNDVLIALAGNIDDWQTIERDTVSDVISHVQVEHRVIRCVLNLEACLLNIVDTLKLELLNEVEDELKRGVGLSRVKALLLIAPLKPPHFLSQCISIALADGCGAVADLLESIRICQPRLSQLVGHWLEIPETAFLDYPGGRCALWRTAVESGTLVAALDATNRDDFKKAWTALNFFGQTSPVARIATGRVAEVLTSRIFPGQRYEPVIQKEIIHEKLAGPIAASAPRRMSATLERDRALSQIDTIIECVARGDDSRARSYLRELIATQTSDASFIEHAVKSLCNVASQCAELFRTDFERECLETAVAIAPNDSWTLIQLGNHFKRIAEYDRALQILERAQSLGDSAVAKSAIADVWSQRGELEKAIVLYRQISDHSEPVIIRTAIADNLRRQGKFSDALAEYDSLIADGLVSDRIIAGKAEIDKREGRLEDAISKYQGLASKPDLGVNDRLIFKMALAGLFKRQGMFREALRIVDVVSHSRPFWMQARILKASILGLMGQYAEALKGLHANAAPRAFGEWLQPYVRGLLLLLVDQYSDAKRELMENFNSKLIFGESQTILRLGAVVAFLRDRDDLSMAQKLLLQSSEVPDKYVEYLRTVLHFHIAMARQDWARTQELGQRLEASNIREEPYQSAIVAIKEKRWKAAWEFEVAALLRLAAA